MIVYELYINDTQCEISEDSEITLVYQSGLFQELDIIQSNRSYDIELPLTATNMSAIGHSERTDVSTQYPYRKLPARLYRNGVPIFTSGRAVITEISDSIHVTLTWGNVDNFDPLFDSDMRDLAQTLYDMGYGYQRWDEDSSILTGPSDSSSPASTGFYGIDFGQGLDNPRYWHPSIMVYRVMEAIEQYNGITIDGVGRLSPTLLLPCVSKNGDEMSGKTESARFVTRISKDANHILLAAESSTIEDLTSEGGRLFDIKGATTVEIHIVSNFETMSESFTPVFYICADDTDNRIVSIPYTYKQGDFYRRNIAIDFTTTLSVEDGTLPEDTEYLIFHLYNGSRSDTEYTGSNYIDLLAYPREEVHFPSLYPIGVNLPDMSQGDFVSSILAMNGLFAYADKDSPDTIKLMSADDLYNNISSGNFVDWSDRVLIEDSWNPDLPASTEFTVESYAKKNTLDYENDDEVDINTAGEIVIDNDNIDEENDLASLPFSATKNKSFEIGTGDDAYPIDIAYIPIYTTDDTSSSSEVSYDECSPRIIDYRVAASPDETSRWCYGVFNATQRFGGNAGIVKSKYASLQKILNNLRIVKVRVKLSDLDLYNLRFDVPVFISQYGGYFAIYSVETTSGEVCDCTFVKINTEE